MYKLNVKFVLKAEKYYFNKCAKKILLEFQINAKSFTSVCCCN